MKAEDKPQRAATGMSDALARGLLLAGVLVGALLAALGVVEPGGALPAGAVATVNGVVIERSTYEQVLAGLAEDRRDGAGSEEMRRRALDRLIEEELLVQHALSLGLARRDPRIRPLLTDAVLASIAHDAEADAEEPSEEALQAFYRREQGRFRAVDLLKVRQLWFSDTGETSSLKRAYEARDRLWRGESWEALGELSDDPGAPLPGGWLPPHKLRDYVGDAAARRAVAMAPGELSEPIRGPGGHRVLGVLERREGPRRSLEDDRALVVAAWRRERSEAALRQILDQLRSDAHVVTEGAP